MNLEPSKARDSLLRITNICTGADGGGDFLKLRFFLEDLEKLAKSGDDAAKQLLEVLYRFEKLCNVACKREFRQTSAA